jgi:hypothetical protein
MSGMVAGQIPIAAGASTVTSSGNLSGDVTTSGSLVTTLATVNANVGTFQGLVLDGKGRVTAASNQAYLTTVSAASTYAPLASPTFTGTPTLPTGTVGVTQAVATNNTTLATTAFVQSRDALYLPLAGGTLSGDLTVNASINSFSASLPTSIASRSIVGGSLASAQLLGFNAYFDGGGWRYLGTGTWYATMVNNDNTAGIWNLGITNAAGAAGAAASPTNRLVVQRDGTCLNTTGTWTAISDASVKTNLAPYTRGLDAVLALEPVSFVYNERSPYGLDGTTRFGLIAQQVEPHVPEAVGRYDYKPDGEKEAVKLSTIDPGHLIYVLVNAIKELSAKVAALEAAK